VATAERIIAMRWPFVLVAALLLFYVNAKTPNRSNTSISFDAAFHECFYSPRAPRTGHTAKSVGKSAGVSKEGDLFFDAEQFPASRAEACTAVIEADDTSCPQAYLRAVSPRPRPRLVPRTNS